MAKGKQKRKQHGKPAWSVVSPKRRREAAGRRRFDEALDAFREDDDVHAKMLLLKWEHESELPINALTLLLEICHRSNDMPMYAVTALALAAAQPNDPQNHLSAAGGCLASQQPALATFHFKEVLRLAPKHPMAEFIERQLTDLRAVMARLKPALQLDDASMLRRYAAIEHTILLMGQGRLQSVLRLTKKLLLEFPDEVRLLNNQTETFYQLGRWSEALESLDCALECDPTNYYAHANRCRIGFMRGDFESSDRDAARLLELQPRQASDLTKAAEAFAMRGDDIRVFEALDRLNREHWEKDSSKDSALLYHFAAVAHCRGGNLEQAKEHWHQSIKYSGLLPLAESNLEDLRQPIENRCGPFYFSAEYWLTPNVLKDFVDFYQSASESDEPGDGKAFEQLLWRHPQLGALIPAMLDRGDRLCQQLAINLAKAIRSPETISALIRYAQSTRGSDSDRYTLAVDLKQMDWLPSTELELFVAGKPCRIELLNFNITDEPNINPSRLPEVDRLAQTALDALQRRDGQSAEKQLRRAIELEDDAPDLWNNLAMSLLIQNSDRSAYEILDMVSSRWPEYFFGQLATANRWTQSKQFDKAIAILDKLQRKDEFHRTEFIGLCKGFIQYELARQVPIGRSSWLKMLERFSPEDKDLPRIKRQMAAAAKPKPRFLSRLGWGKEQPRFYRRPLRSSRKFLGF